jgi:hypothetical protein
LQNNGGPNKNEEIKGESDVPCVNNFLPTRLVHAKKFTSPNDSGKNSMV